MARLFEPQTALRIQHRSGRLNQAAQSRFGMDAIKQCQEFKIDKQRLLLGSGLSREVLKNPPHFPLHRKIGFLDVIIEIHEVARFDEHRGAARRHIVHDARHVTFAFGFDGQHIAILALGEIGFL